MSSLSRSVFFLSMFLPCTSALAQTIEFPPNNTPNHVENVGYLPGYIVTNNGDTTQGLVKNKSSMGAKILQTIKFKASEHADVQQFEPEQLKSFMVGTQRYVSVKFFTGTKERQAFMDVIVDGDMCYYEYKSSPIGHIKAGEVIRVLQRKKDRDFFSVYGGDLKKRLAEFLHDDRELSAMAAEGKFDVNDMADVAATYNGKKNMQRNPGLVDTGEIFFFKPYHKYEGKFFLTVNDTISYTVEEAFKKRIRTPLGVNSKFCYGTAKEKDCISIMPKARPAKVDYYLLRANDAGTKFRIEQSSAIVVQKSQFGDLE